uniref:hypothetical protein n=1 Tax=Bartonella sp. AP18SXNS TaxID=3243472 RepID=UPI0035CFF96F
NKDFFSKYPFISSTQLKKSLPYNNRANTQIYLSSQHAPLPKFKTINPQGRKSVKQQIRKLLQTHIRRHSNSALLKPTTRAAKREK